MKRYNKQCTFGVLAQLVEHLAGSQRVRGSSPLYSTKYSDHSIEWSFSFWGGVSKVNKNGSLYERELSAQRTEGL